MDYVDRIALRDALYEADAITMRGVAIINSMPAADVVPVRHGRWITPTSICGRAFQVPHCSVCGGVPCGVDENTKYCPSCGARMDGDGE